MSNVSQIQTQIGLLNACIAHCEEKIKINKDKINKIIVARINVESAQSNLISVKADNSFKWVADNMINYWVIGDSSSINYILNDDGIRGQVAQNLYSLNEIATVDGGIIGGIVNAVMSDADKKLLELETDISECVNQIENYQNEIQSLVELLNITQQQGVEYEEN